MEELVNVNLVIYIILKNCKQNRFFPIVVTKENYFCAFFTYLFDI